MGTLSVKRKKGYDNKEICFFKSVKIIFLNIKIARKIVGIKDVRSNKGSIIYTVEKIKNVKKYLLEKQEY